MYEQNNSIMNHEDVDYLHQNDLLEGADKYVDSIRSMHGYKLPRTKIKY